MKNELIELDVGDEKSLDNGTDQMIDGGIKYPKGMKDVRSELFKKVNYGFKVMTDLLVVGITNFDYPATYILRVAKYVPRNAENVPVDVFSALSLRIITDRNTNSLCQCI